MMCFKAIVLVAAIVCLIGAETKPLKERIFNCKPFPLKKHHSIFESIVPSIVVSPVDPAIPGDYAVPGEYTVPAEVTTLGTEPVPVPTAVPAEPQHPPQQEVQYPSPQPEVQYPAPPQEEQTPAVPQQQQVPSPPQQQPLYPPQHEGQRPVQHHAEQNPPSDDGSYPPQLNGGQYYPPQNEGQYYQPPIEGMYYPPQNYQGFSNYNVPYNYPVYGQNVLRSVKSLDGQTFPLHPYRVNMFIRQPTPYYGAPAAHVYDRAYAAPLHNYVSQAPRTAQALTGGKAKST